MNCGKSRLVETLHDSDEKSNTNTRLRVLHDMVPSFNFLHVILDLVLEQLVFLFLLCIHISCIHLSIVAFLCHKHTCLNLKLDIIRVFPSNGVVISKNYKVVSVYYPWVNLDYTTSVRL